MSYNTNFSLSVRGPDSRPALAVLRKFRSVCPEAAEALDEDGSPADSAKWYDHEEHLIEFSRKHADCVFFLRGEGEEPGDEWVKRFQNGRVTVEQSAFADEDDQEDEESPEDE